jgi:hypothetical protein
MESMMDHDNSINRETLDDDILQCRADIMKNRKSPSPSARTDNVAATPPVADEKTVRIPAFEDLARPKKQVVDGQWETSLKVKPESDIDPAQIVTAEEEAALFPVTEPPATEHDNPHTQQYASNHGLDALREVVAQADDTDNIEPISNPEESSDNTSMIPELNLAEKILTEQRHVASKRRQRPAAARNLNIMPIAGTVGKIIEEAKKAVAQSGKKNNPVPETPAAAEPEKKPDKKPLAFDRIEVEKVEKIEIVEPIQQIEKIEIDEQTEQIDKIEQEHQEPVLSVAACRIVNDSDRLNPFQEDIISDIVSRDIAQFCGELENL